MKTVKNATAAANAGAQPRAFDPWRARRDFPQLQQQVNGKPLVYLDNAATTQKPNAVLDAVRRYYTTECSNVHRGVHTLSVNATADYERTREKVRSFVNAADTREVVFLRSTTEAINLVASSYGNANVSSGDEVLITGMEHHSNIVPWQLLCERVGAILRVVPIDDSGDLIVDEFDRLLGSRTRIVALPHISNSLGTRNALRQLIEMVHTRGVPVLVDGAQAAAHAQIDVQDLDADFYAFSAHKMYGPTGVGVLYGKAELLEAMPPYQGGGEMIRTVSFEKTTFNDLPFKFEAGTPNVAGVIGLGAAVDYLESLGRGAIAVHETELLARATEAVRQVPRVRLIGTAREKASILSFVVEGVHAHDVGTVLDDEGVAVRAGHHCAQPVMDRFGVPATCRASMALYNTEEDVERLVAALHKALEIFR